VNKFKVAAARRPGGFKGKPALRKPPVKHWPKRLALILAGIASAFYLAIALSLVVLRSWTPVTTAVQTERRIHAWMQDKPYHKDYQYAALRNISPHLMHAVIAAEDTRFFQHHGFDWEQVGQAIEQDEKTGRRRGASTITQQLARNLFLNTGPSIARKGLEFSIVPLTEAILPKNRILELYLNVIEWGPGIYGAEAASRAYYHESARQVTRDHALELASLLPAPLHRRPKQAEWYVAHIRQRMAQMGW
jgi:monofunctional biosynthetic peptidoglycan transglycosylase